MVFSVAIGMFLWYNKFVGDELHLMHYKGSLAYETKRNDFMTEIYIYMLLYFLAPIGIFCLFWAFKKPFWSAAVYLPLLLYSIIKNVFFIGTYKGFWEEIDYFLHSDAVIAVFFMWLPSIAGFVLINIICLIFQKIKAKNQKSQ